MMLRLRLNRANDYLVDVNVYDDGGFCGAVTLDRATWDGLVGETLIVNEGDELSLSTFPLAVHRQPKRKGKA